MITRIGKFYRLFAPWNTTQWFYPNNPKASAKTAGIVDKVYLLLVLSLVFEVFLLAVRCSPLPKNQYFQILFWSGTHEHVSRSS